MFDNMKIGKLAQTVDPGGLPFFQQKCELMLPNKLRPNSELWIHSMAGPRAETGSVPGAGTESGGWWGPYLTLPDRSPVS